MTPLAPSNSSTSSSSDEFFIESSGSASTPLSPSWTALMPCEYCEAQLKKDREIEEGMRLFASWTATEDEDASVEPETHDSLLMAALLSTKESQPSSGVVRTFSCPDLLMTSLAVLLLETRHFRYLSERQALPSAVPKWMRALEESKEMDPPNSLVTTVSLPSDWDAVSARLSTSSIFNLFSDEAVSPSLFSIDPTGVSSTGSTVSVPPSFWDAPSTVSVTGPAPSTFEPRPLTSSASSSVSVEPSDESSSSSLFMDPTSAPSTDSLFSYSLSSSSLPSIDGLCGRALPLIYRRYALLSSSSDESTGPLNKTFLGLPEVDNLSASTGYETDVDSEPMILATTVSTTEQSDGPTQSDVARMLAECDDLMEKLEEMRKKLREML